MMATVKSTVPTASVISRRSFLQSVGAASTCLVAGVSLGDVVAATPAPLPALSPPLLFDDFTTAVVRQIAAAMSIPYDELTREYPRVPTRFIG